MFKMMNLLVARTAIVGAAEVKVMDLATCIEITGHGARGHYHNVRIAGRGRD